MKQNTVDGAILVFQMSMSPCSVCRNCAALVPAYPIMVTSPATGVVLDREGWLDIDRSSSLFDPYGLSRPSKTVAMATLDPRKAIVRVIKLA